MGKFDKVQALVDPTMEARLMHELEPVVSDVYDQHMMTRPTKYSDPDSVDVVVGTIDPLRQLYSSAKLDPQEVITPELIEAIKGPYDDHIASFLEKGVDLQTPIRLAGQMNLGTENNLEWYFGTQYAYFRDFPALLEMLSRWTAEEKSHGPIIELWGMISGSLSPREAHAVKMALINGGIEVFTDSLVAINAFTEPQEYDTDDAHTNFSHILDKQSGRNMRHVAGQERRHGNMFGAIGDAIYALDQEFIDYALPIEVETHRRFGMPAEGSYPEFADVATEIAVHGLFTLDGVLERQRQRVDRLKLLEIPVTTDRAKQAQSKLADVVDIDSRLNSRRVREIDEATELYIEREKRAGRIPAILGRTIVQRNGGLEIVPDAA